jgi:hypothetical protein
MGFLGIFVFVGVMFYVPMAQAHQAVTGSYDQILWIAG